MEYFSGTRMYAHVPIHVHLHTSVRTLIPINKRIHKHYHSYIQAVVFLKHFLSIANMIRVLVELVCTSVSLFCLFLNVFLLFCVKQTNQIGGEKRYRTTNRRSHLSHHSVLNQVGKSRYPRPGWFPHYLASCAAGRNCSYAWICYWGIGRDACSRNPGHSHHLT